MNSKALEAAGITRDTPDPPAGAITRDPAGQPDGLLKESAQQLVRRVMPPITRDDQRRALLAGIARAHQLGVTSVQNASGNAEEFALYEGLRRSGELKLRVYSALSVAPGFSDADADRFDTIRASVAGDRTFKAGAAKILIDGVIETNTAVMLAPYDNNPATPGCRTTRRRSSIASSACSTPAATRFDPRHRRGGVRGALDAFEERPGPTRRRPAAGAIESSTSRRWTPPTCRASRRSA